MSEGGGTGDADEVSEQVSEAKWREARRGQDSAWFEQASEVVSE